MAAAAPAAVEEKKEWKGGWKSRKPPPSIPDDYEVDKDAKYTGTVESYAKWQGYGFITPDQAGLVPDNKLWVHWSNIQTDDRFPFLTKDLKVEFGLMKWTNGRGDKKTTSLRAKRVTSVGGSSISVQEELDAEKKEFFGGQKTRYKGMLKFYVAKMGYGYVTIDPGQISDESVPKELRVEEPEVNCGGRRPRGYMESTAVEFGIVKSKKGNFMVYNMTLPGGTAMTKAVLEHRVDQASQTFRGTVSHFRSWQGWGFIAPETAAFLPQDVQQALAKQQAAAKEKSKKEGDETPAQVFYFTKNDTEKGMRIEKDMKVVFKVYLDDKGAGAFEVTPATD